MHQPHVHGLAAKLGFWLRAAESKIFVTMWVHIDCEGLHMLFILGGIYYDWTGCCIAS